MVHSINACPNSLTCSFYLRQMTLAELLIGQIMTSVTLKRHVPTNKLSTPWPVLCWTERIGSPKTSISCAAATVHGYTHKKALLSQRRPRDAPNIWVPWKVSRVLANAPATFPEIYKGLLFRSILRMCIQNLKFVALSVPEIIRGTQNIWAVPRYAHAPFSLKFLNGFCSDGPCEHTSQIWSS